VLDAGGKLGRHAVEAARDALQVHRAAATVRASVPTAEQLGHHRLGRDAAGQRETVTAVAGDEQVIAGHRMHDVGHRRLLARRQVAVAADVRRLVLALGLRLEGPVSTICS
jgi:hypothetical protein